MTLPRTTADVLSRHVLFEVESVDRMYLNVYQPKLQYGGGVSAFFAGHRGHKYASSVLMAPITETFVANIHHFIAARGLDLLSFGKGEDKDAIAHKYLAAFEGENGVLFVGRAQEKAWVFRTRKRRNPATGKEYLWLTRATLQVNYFYFYCVDEDFGPFFIKFCSYFPYGAKLCINGNHWAQRQAEKAGIGFTPMDNAFAAVEDVPALQAICDSFGEEHIRALLAKWLRILPYPFTDDDTAAGYRYDASIVQAEFSLTQMLDKPVTGRIFLEQMIRDNLDLGRPDKISLIFGRRVHNGRKRPTQPVPHPGRDGQRPSGRPDRVQALEGKAVPQGRESAAHRNCRQRSRRLRHRQRASEPARTAAGRLHRQPAPAERPENQPRPRRRRRRDQRHHQPCDHPVRDAHPRPALHRRTRPGPALRCVRVQAAAQRIHQPRPPHPPRATARQAL
jgi:hypothetical protein